MRRSLLVVTVLLVLNVAVLYVIVENKRTRHTVLEQSPPSSAFPDLKTGTPLAPIVRKPSPDEPARVRLTPTKKVAAVPNTTKSAQDLQTLSDTSRHSTPPKPPKRSATSSQPRGSAAPTAPSHAAASAKSTKSANQPKPHTNQDSCTLTATLGEDDFYRLRGLFRPWQFVFRVINANAASKPGTQPQVEVVFTNVDARAYQDIHGLLGDYGPLKSAGHCGNIGG